MADINKQPNDPEPKSPVPSDADLFVGHVQNDYSAQDIFAGDDSLYESLAGAETGHPAGIDKAPASIKETKPRLAYPSGPSFSLLQKVLAGSILGVAVILAYAVFKTPKNALADANVGPLLDVNIQSTPALAVTEPAESNAVWAQDMAQSSEPTKTQTSATEGLTPPPLSLKIAQDMFEAGQYRQAYSVYQQIQHYLPSSDKEAAFNDFLTLHKALCLTMNQEFMPARQALALAAKSEIPIIRVMTNYTLSRLELSQNQFMPARARACEALGLLDALKDQHPAWLADLKQTCCFLAAQATSKQALILCDADRQLPSALCPDLPLITNPWYNLNETQVRQALARSSSLLPSLLLAPSISKNGKTPKNPWSVSCHRMAVDELLARFGANASLEVVWHDQANHADLRKRAISLFIEDVPDQTAVSLATGIVGLLAHIEDEHTIHVLDPASVSLVSEQVAILAQQAIIMWQQYLFSGKESPYFANAHFTSGLLYKLMAVRNEALSEFKLVTSRYSRSNLAPYALLYASQIKEELHDATGAQYDLTQLVEQYPEVPIVTEALLHLATTVIRQGNHQEAAKLYRKVFYLNLSEESRTLSALNAGRSFFNIKDYNSAELWLTQYIQLVEGQNAKEVHSAFFTLGKSLLALSKPKMACQAFHHALEGDLDRQEYLETIANLVQAYTEQQDPMEALDVLENAFNAPLAPSDILELNLLKSVALRHAGFLDRSIELLQNTKGSVADPALNAKLGFELSLSLIEHGDLAEAQRELSNALVKVKSGPLAHKLALTLAQVCLDLKQEDQAVSVCQGVLELEPDQTLSQRASQLLAKAYTHQQDYNKAALALMGQWK